MQHSTLASDSRRRSSRRRGAYGYVGTVILGAILGNVLEWHFSLRYAAANDAAVAQNVQVMRSAVDLYQTEHEGKFPRDNGNVMVKDLLLQYSNLEGTVVSPRKDVEHGVIYGPYLRTIPALTVGKRRGASGIGSEGGEGITWIYNPKTGEVRANIAGKDHYGKPYADY